MSPSLASSSTWAGSFFSSPLWKRVFSSSSTSPFFIFAIASSAVLPMQSAAKATGRLMMLGDRGGDGLERIGLVRAALGPAEMGEKNDLAALVGDLRDGRRDALDARRIGHPAVLGRNVEVDAQQHALAGDIGVVEGAERFAHGPHKASRRSVDRHLAEAVQSSRGREPRHRPRFRRR